MNKLQLLIEGRVAELELATECQSWKHLAYLDTSSSRDDYCWNKAMAYSDKGSSILEFSHRLVGEKFVNRKGTYDAVLFDPRVKLALVLWSEEHTKAKKTYEQWLECADLRLLKEVT